VIDLGRASGLQMQKVSEQPNGEKTYAIIFAKEDEVLSGLTAFAAREKITAGYFTAIGALRRAKFGWFDLAHQAYRNIPVDRQVELISLIGDVGLVNGKPQVHAHGAVGLPDGQVRGGHLLGATVFPTLEVFFTALPTTLVKNLDDETTHSLSSTSMRECVLPRFLGMTVLLFAGIMNMMAQPIQPEIAYFADDGSIPNNALPLLLYRQALPPATPDLASAIEERFARNDWTGSWRASVFPFHHYHSTTHEVLGVYRGTATLQLGGEKGRQFVVKAGDVIVIPAGVGHKRVESSEGFSVVGAYPGGRQWDLLRGLPGERPQADRNIAAVPLPENDPLYGANGALKQIWKSQ
jgi:uncharacterized protein YjlB/predicted DNA-binding protein with PD1-like motif